MTQTPRTLFTALLATLALLAAPALASAEYLVPEGNSAVTQYTEGFPTGGGEKKAEGSKKVTPGKTIGAGNAKKLEQHSPEGKAVAEVAAETAPPSVPAPTETSGGDNEPEPRHQAKDKQGEQKSSSQQQKTHKAKEQGDEKQNEDATAPAASGEGPSGSSGSGEVLGAATGLSSGSLGILLPLIILAAIAWALYYAWRRRQQPHPEPSRP